MERGPASTVYKTQEFATLTGVTVKALRHYDRLGLLKPRRTGARYRLYTPADRQRLEQIAAFKFIGLSLKQIRTLLDSRLPDAAGALRAQRRVLEEQRTQLDRAMHAIDWELYEAERLKQGAGIVHPPARLNEAHVSLYHDIVAAIHAGSDATSERGRALIARWRAIVDDEMQDADEAVKTRIKEFWAGRKTWPPSLKKYVATLYRLEPAAWERATDFIDSGTKTERVELS